LGDNDSCCPDTASVERDYLDIELSDMARGLFSHKLGELFGSSLRDGIKFSGDTVKEIEDMLSLCLFSK
jgi:hypothetical protein